jgi:predicted DNA-binding transcriptional regulator YafY
VPPVLGTRLGACCRLRQDFRNFRLDRILELETLAETVPESDERGLATYLREVGAGPGLEP